MTKPKVTKKAEKERKPKLHNLRKFIKKAVRPVKKIEKAEKVEQAPHVEKAPPSKRVKPDPVVIDEHIPAQDAIALQAMLNTLLLNDARARLAAAKEDGNPDAIIAALDVLYNLENG